MNQKEEPYLQLNRIWKSTCKTLFGGEAGELADFSKYLCEYNQQLVEKPSCISSKPVHFACPFFYKGGKWASLDEIDWQRKYPPLSINDVKDIDSIVEAAKERIVYCGDIVLGNSKFVCRSSNVADSFWIADSAACASSKNVASSFTFSFSEAMFGCQQFGYTQHCIRSIELTKCSRCFESLNIFSSADIYYSHGLIGCHDCLFCFNLRNRRFAIGNLELPREKYLQVKGKLLADVLELLQKQKRAPSLIKIIADSKFAGAKASAAWEEGAQKRDISFIEDAFSKTTSLVFGKPLKGIREYGRWLQKYTAELKEVQSAISGKPLFYPPNYAKWFLLPTDRMIRLEEMEQAGERRLAESEAVSISLENARLPIGKIAYLRPQFEVGSVSNMVECTLSFDSQDCFRAVLSMEAKRAGYSYLNRLSEYVFGCHEIRSSSFVINCYHSTRLARCFEVDSSRDCSGSYFLHNCENVHDSMFCFNVKNLKYAIGNAEVGREKFMEAKAALQKYIVERLEKERKLELDIYNIGANRF